MSSGGGTIKGTYVVIGVVVTLLTCLLVVSNGSDATADDITVSGTVSVVGWNETQIDQLVIAFVSEDHITAADVDSTGHYSVSLKADHDYNVRSFNMKSDLQPISTASSASSMSWVLYKDIHTPQTDCTLDNLVLEKGENYTAPNGARYYLYESGFATLNRLDIQYDDLTGNPQATVKADQTFTIPEYIEKDDKSYKVTFVGRSPSVQWKDVIWPYNNNQSNDIYYGPTSNTLTIRFEGDVILNCQPFTSPTGVTNPATASSTKYNFNIVFDKDVYVNSYPIIVDDSPRLIASPQSLLGIGNVSIAGVYHGAILLSNAGQISYGTGNYGLANTHFETITFSPELVASSISDTGSSMLNADVNSLGLIAGTSMTAVLDQDSGKYILKNGDAVVCESVTSVTNKVKFTTVVGDVTETVIITKGQTRSLEDVVAPDGYRFGGWFLDSEYLTEYDPTVALNDNTTVYAKFISLTCTITITGDGIVIKNGDDVIESGAVIRCGSELAIITDIRAGYSCTVKVDGVAIAASSITAPVSDFVISCEWAEAEYTVNCIDEGTNVETIPNCHYGDAITLPAAPAKADMNFNGWKINGLMLGAQYVVDYRDVEDGDVITLTADYSAVVKTSWSLTVNGEGIQGKVFYTSTNAIGTYGMITVLPDEFETATYTVSSNGGYGIISDNCAMVYSIDGNDVTVTVEFKDVGKASEYDVSVAEIASGEKHGFKATVTAKDGYVDSAGKFAISYVYKTWNDTDKVWVYTTSGVTEGVENATVTIPTDKKVSSVTGEFLLDNDSATLVFGFATFSFKGTSVTGTEDVVTVHSPVIMCVSEIQAVVGKP